MFYDKSVVPVIMFHSVGLEKSDWIYSRISEPLDKFEEKIRFLSLSKFNFIFWQELFNYMDGSEILPLNSIMLTFDDGYLDNWVYALPILKKYGAKATIFVNPEFVDPMSEIRPTIEDVWGNRITQDQLRDHGFLSWGEMREMEKTKLIDIQSHSLTHTWYFSGPNIIDFHSPGNRKYPWLFWNNKPELKPYYMDGFDETIVPYGTPIYEFRKSLICQRYFPPTIVNEKLVEFVSNKGSKNFFKNKNWKKILNDYFEKISKDYNVKGFFESTIDYEKRIYIELKKSKFALENMLNKKVSFICWPGGAYNNKVLEIAKDVGYKAWTLSSQDQSRFRNRFRCGKRHIKRMGSFHTYKRGSDIYGYAGLFYFKARLNFHRGSLFFGLLCRFLLFFEIIKTKLCKIFNFRKI